MASTAKLTVMMMARTAMLTVMMMARTAMLTVVMMARTAMMAMIASMTKNLLISRPEISSSSLGARQKMIESRRKVKVRFTF